MALKVGDYVRRKTENIYGTISKRRGHEFWVDVDWSVTTKEAFDGYDEACPWSVEEYWEVIPRDFGHADNVKDMASYYHAITGEI